MANCKPGDMAVIVALRDEAKHLYGYIVEVLERAPEGRFRLPNGRIADGASPGAIEWVIKFCRPVGLPLTDGATFHGEYAVMHDRGLRPLPGIPADESESTDQPIAEVA